MSKSKKSNKSKSKVDASIHESNNEEQLDNLGSDNKTVNSKSRKTKTNKSELLDEKKIIINTNCIHKYWQNQQPYEKGQKYIDQIFPPITESLLDKKVKTAGVDNINIHEIDWKKIKEILGNDIVLFPWQTAVKNEEEKEEEGKEIEAQNINEPGDKELIINFTENKGILFDSYSQFFQAVNLLLTIPGLIEQIFKTKEINPDGYYELYVYAHGEYKILILDDFFPIVKGTSSLRFSKPNKKEIWLLLLEKAYAKANGGYASLISSTITSILETFLGFPCEKINFYDIDLEDLENIIRIQKTDNWIFCIPSEIGNSKGLYNSKGYQFLDIFDIRTKDENNEEKNLKLLKIKNDFPGNKYTGDFSNESPSWNEDIKRIVEYKDEEKTNTFYMTIDDFYLYFNRIEIISPMFDSNTKLIKICNNESEIDKITMPQCFNLFIPKPSKISFSIIIRNKHLEIETTQYDQDLTTYDYIVPSTICYAKFDSETKTFKGFEGGFSSKSFTELTRELDRGFYVIWTYIQYQNSNDPKPEEYFLKISSRKMFKARFQCTDYKFHLIHELVHSAILQNQGPHIKSDEIYTMNDSYYNLTGLGLKIIINPFQECFQRWEFQPDLENMVMLYPYNTIPQFETEVLPKNFFLMLAMKVNSDYKCNFDTKSHFKTVKVNQEETKEQYSFTFNAFCSEDVMNEKIESNYFDYINKETLERIQSIESKPEENKIEEQPKNDEINQEIEKKEEL